jgi:hypothetical protein
MVKNIIIGVLIVLVMLLFFYGVTQQIEAGRQAKQAAEAIRELSQLKQSKASQQSLEGNNGGSENQNTGEECQSQLKAVQKTAELERQKAIAAEKDALNQMKLAEQHAKKMADALRSTEEARKLAEAELDKIKKKK